MVVHTPYVVATGRAIASPVAPPTATVTDGTFDTVLEPVDDPMVHADDVSAYLRTVGVYIDIVTEASMHSAAGASDSLSLENLAQIASLFSVMEVIYPLLQDLEPPTILMSAHLVLLESVGMLASNGERCRGAIMQMNSSVVSSCTDLIENSTELLRMFTSTVADAMTAESSSTLDGLDDAQGDAAGASIAARTPSPSSGGTASTSATADFTIEMHDIFFDPDELTIPANLDITILLDNSGAAAEHSFVNSALGIDEELDPGETRIIAVNVPAGNYDIICDIPGHREAGMTMTLVAT
ncbi:MAG: cupredoxin domain-containing protein [Thermomicrobiales bacterium]|nr:cupredoxin domain-containing protein [Thermomicrobiales bacterium]